MDALVAFDEDTVITGSHDGLIRLVSILPNRMLAVVGEHGDYPVETLALSANRRYLMHIQSGALQDGSLHSRTRAVFPWKQRCSASLSCISGGSWTIEPFWSYTFVHAQ